MVFGWDMADVCYDNARYTGWHTGYPDAMARIDLATYREVPWDNRVPFFLADFQTEAGAPLPICPRQLLKRVVERARAAGFLPLTSLEYEWFNFRETSQSLADKGFAAPAAADPRHVRLLDPAPQPEPPVPERAVRRDGRLRRAASRGCTPRPARACSRRRILYGDALEAADRAVLFKTGAKEIGHRFGIMPTFMAKWNADLPGCSGHIHQSLWDAERQAQPLSRRRPPPPHEHAVRKLPGRTAAHHAGAAAAVRPHGQQLQAPDRGRLGPTKVNWGIDNRTTALRVIPGSPKSTRLETRVNGSDTNPYLALAAALAGGLYGIEQQADAAARTGRGQRLRRHQRADAAPQPGRGHPPAGAVGAGARRCWVPSSSTTSWPAGAGSGGSGAGP